MTVERGPGGGNGNERPRRELEEQARDLQTRLNEAIALGRATFEKKYGPLTNEAVCRDFYNAFDNAVSLLMSVSRDARRFLGAADYAGLAGKYRYIENLLHKAEEQRDVLDMERNMLTLFVFTMTFIAPSAQIQKMITELKAIQGWLEKKRRMHSPDDEGIDDQFIASKKQECINKLALMQEALNVVQSGANSQALKEQVQHIINTLETARAQVEGIGEREH